MAEAEAKKKTAEAKRKAARASKVAGTEKALEEARSLLAGLEAKLALNRVTPQQWYDFGLAAVKPGLDYYKKRFVDVDVVNTGHGRKQINKGLQATEAFLCASVFDPSYVAGLEGGFDAAVVVVKEHIRGLAKSFDFVTAEDAADAEGEAEAVVKHMLRHSTIPAVCLRDEVAMQKGNVGKKAAALMRIKA